jgi:putative ABC transport system permease protein
MNSMLQDIRYAVRILAKAPGFTAIAVLTLALGIGGNTAIFSVINSVLLEPLPFQNPSQLVDLRESESAPGNYPLDGADYLDWQKQNSTFSSMSLYTYPQGFNASGVGAPESAAVRRTQANFFQTLGVQPLIGRTFATGEDQGVHRVVILSYGFWQRHFAAQADALGKTLDLDDEPYTVIGVTPRWLNFPAATDLFVPLDMTSSMVHNRGSHWINGVGRMKPGISITQARADLMTVSERLIKEYRSPDDTSEHSLIFPLKDYLVGGSQEQLLILFGAVALVLLVACANIANLLLARATSRQRELAVRAALGAGRWRLTRQLLTESILLALAGAALGVIGAGWGVSALNAAQTSPIPRINPVELNTTVLIFTVVVSVLAGILFGLAPALRTSQLDLSEELKSSANAVVSATGSGRVLRNSLMVGEIAVSLALLVGAGLLMRSFARIRSANIGVNPYNVLTMNLDLPEARYNTLDKKEQFFRQMLATIGEIPGVKNAAVSTEIPLEGGSNGYVHVPGDTNPAQADQLVEENFVSPDYFKTFGIPLIEGRNFTEEDIERAGETSPKIYALLMSAKDVSKVKVPPALSQVVVINEAMAKTFWPKQDPVGKAYIFGGAPAVVIGVVGNERQWGIRQPAIPGNYFPLTVGLAFPGGTPGVISLKTAVPPANAVGAVRSAVESVDSTLAVYHVRTMEDVIAENMQDTTLETFLLGTFSALALALACVGLYGVMSYLVTQRTHEIGIRMALGAQHRDILCMVISQGAKLVVFGVAIGVGAALGLTQLLSAELFGVKATDPGTYVAVAVLLAMVALAACYVPAYRATKVDPMVALRYE